MTVRLIWAEAHDRVIGAAGTIPWRLPEDMRQFRERTTGSTVVMGRGTWESLPAGARPLPERRNVVLTRDPGWSAAGAERAGSVPEVLAKHDDVWIIGGAAVYAAFLPHADRVVRTRIDLAVAGDARAPELDPERRPADPEWQPADREWQPADREWRPAGVEWRAAGVDAAGWQTSRTGLRYRIDEFVRAQPA